MGIVFWHRERPSGVVVPRAFRAVVDRLQPWLAELCSGWYSDGAFGVRLDLERKYKPFSVEVWCDCGVDGCGGGGECPRLSVDVFEISIDWERHLSRLHTEMMDKKRKQVLSICTLGKVVNRKDIGMVTQQIICDGHVSEVQQCYLDVVERVHGNVEWAHDGNDENAFSAWSGDHLVAIVMPVISRNSGGRGRWLSHAFEGDL